MKVFFFIIIAASFLNSSSAIAQADFEFAAKPIANAIAKIPIVVFKSDSSFTNKKEDTATITNSKILFGIASFYSKNLEGSKTSTGERFHHKLMTAASNNFALNTWVRVTNIRNEKSVIVRINDHMAVRMAKRGRVVDLSHSAAKKLDFILLGLVKVKVEQVAEGTLE